MDRTETPSGLSWRLRERRRELGLTQEALAAKAGVSREYVSRIEVGDKRTPHAVNKLAEALGVEPLWLTTGLDCYASHIEGARHVSCAGLAAAGNLPDDPPKMSGNLAGWPADVLTNRYAGVLKFLLGAVLGASIVAAWALT